MSLGKCSICISQRTFVNVQPNTHMYMKSLKQYSKIDYFLVSGCFDDLLDYHVIESDCNFSDHLPIAIALSRSDKLIFNNHVPNNSQNFYSSNDIKHLRWDHGNTSVYY